MLSSKEIGENLMLMSEFSIRSYSGYRLLWMQVIFDLPVVTRVQRKRATQFRNSLLELGFSMVQFSVYMRHCKDRQQAETYIKKVEASIPEEGSVYILVFTDKQYESMRVFSGGERRAAESPEQLLLF